MDDNEAEEVQKEVEQELAEMDGASQQNNPEAGQYWRYRLETHHAPTNFWEYFLKQILQGLRVAQAAVTERWP